jgi:hypothetical protein
MDGNVNFAVKLNETKVRFDGLLDRMRELNGTRHDDEAAAEAAQAEYDRLDEETDVLKEQISLYEKLAEGGALVDMIAALLPDLFAFVDQTKPEAFGVLRKLLSLFNDLLDELDPEVQRAQARFAQYKFRKLQSLKTAGFSHEEAFLLVLGGAGEIGRHLSANKLSFPGRE